MAVQLQLDGTSLVATGLTDTVAFNSSRLKGCVQEECMAVERCEPEEFQQRAFLGMPPDTTCSWCWNVVHQEVNSEACCDISIEPMRGVPKNSRRQRPQRLEDRGLFARVVFIYCNALKAQGHFA